MSKLHHVRVRRARGLPMPLPPKPKARPLGPPVVCVFRDVSIRVRADVVKAAATWDEFLDEVAGVERLPPLQPIATLVPGHERAALVEEIRRRRRRILKERREAAEKAHAEAKAAWDASVAEKGHIGAFIDHIFGRAA
jgi:hypothetical protein